MSDFWTTMGADPHQSLRLALPGPVPAPLGEWKGVVRRAYGPFDPAFRGVAPLIAPAVAALPTLAGSIAETYLPIEALRDEDLGKALHRGRDVARTFRSSGTTQESRAWSRFSAAGLEAYRAQSLYTFLGVLREVAGEAAADLTGLSLIPPVAAWPESSLAQMVHWLSVRGPVRYVEPESLAGAVEDGRPVWLFATAFHLVELLDRRLAVRLPAGSVVVETGGTKGRTRQITRDELYGRLERDLGVPEERIVSEYGMCELATQAYDFVSAGDTGARRFRFPAWVRARVVVGPGEAHAAGRGALLVEDPLRLDAPWALRTEDLVELTADGFRLLGRLPAAPLKGCSLLTEAVRTDGVSSVPAAPATRRVPLSLDPKRTERVFLATAELAQSPESEAALTRELGSRAAARAALADLRAGLPQSVDAWTEAAKVAAGGGDVLAKWLVVLPESHSLVGLYPLALGAVMGLDLTVRMPARFADERSLLALWLRALQTEVAPRLSCVDASFRIQDGTHGYAAILAYGDDETIARLRAVAGCPVQGFGGRFGMSLVDGGRLSDLETNAALLAKDAWGLGQRGCMATRLAVVLASDTLDPVSAGGCVAAAGRDFWQAAMPEDDLLGFELDAWRYRRLGFTLAGGDSRTPLVAARRVALGEITPAFVEQAMARRPMTLPLLLLDFDELVDRSSLVKGTHQEIFVKTPLTALFAHDALSTVTLSARVASALGADSLAKSDWLPQSFRALGAANAPLWNGRHESRALFASSVS